MAYKKAGKILRIFFLLVLAIATYLVIYRLKGNFDFRKYNPIHIAGRYELKGRIRPADQSTSTQYINSPLVHSEPFLDILLEMKRKDFNNSNKTVDVT